MGGGADDSNTAGAPLQALLLYLRPPVRRVCLYYVPARQWDRSHCKLVLYSIAA